MSEAGRGASANSAGIGGFWGAGGAQKGNRRGYSPEHYQARRGAFFALFAGSGSPPPASARSAPRSPESAQGANSPNALARAPSVQPRTGAQGKRFSACPSAFGGVGRMRTGCASAPPSAASPSALLIAPSAVLTEEGLHGAVSFTNCQIQRRIAPPGFRIDLRAVVN